MSGKRRFRKENVKLANKFLPGRRLEVALVLKKNATSQGTL